MIAFISIRKMGQNFGKPIPIDKVQKDYGLAELKQLNLADNIRFYSEDGDLIPAEDAFDYLGASKEDIELSKCKTEVDIERFMTLHADSSLMPQAELKLEELIFKKAETEADYKSFIERFPKSKYVKEAKEHVPISTTGRLVVLCSEEGQSLGQRIIHHLKNKGCNVSISVVEPGGFANFIRLMEETDLVFAIMDDSLYMELFVVFALCDQKEIPVYPVYDPSLSLSKISRALITEQLMLAQASTEDADSIELLRDIRLDLEEHFTKVSKLKSVRLNRLEALDTVLK